LIPVLDSDSDFPDCCQEHFHISVAQSFITDEFFKKVFLSPWNCGRHFLSRVDVISREEERVVAVELKVLVEKVNRSLGMLYRGISLKVYEIGRSYLPSFGGTA
jgi:hypothetical protein